MPDFLEEIQEESMLSGEGLRYMERFYVPDTPDSCRRNGDVSTILLVESPHTDEVEQSECPCNRYPLAGYSGRIVSNYLIYPERGTPIGRLVHDYNSGSNNIRYDRLGIVNVCQFPLQMSCYCWSNVMGNCTSSMTNCLSFLRIMEALFYIKENPRVFIYTNVGFSRIKNRLRREAVRTLTNIIKCDLRRRLNQYSASTHIVCCGEFAKMAYQGIRGELALRIEDCKCVPHPAMRRYDRNPWRNLPNNGNGCENSDLNAAREHIRCLLGVP